MVFVSSDGLDSERNSFIYNYFVLCGPSEDPAGAADCDSVKDAFAAIADGKYPFISRGDGSGTHSKELSLWPEELGITEDAESFADYTDWYTSANAGRLQTISETTLFLRLCAHSHLIELNSRGRTLPREFNGYCFTKIYLVHSGYHGYGPGRIDYAHCGEQFGELYFRHCACDSGNGQRLRPGQSQNVSVAANQSAVPI